MSSEIPAARRPLWNVRASPTARGKSSKIAPSPPNSNTGTRLGAMVFVASMAASMGMPVPMKAVVPSWKSRAATQIINSVLEKDWSVIICLPLFPLFPFIHQLSQPLFTNHLHVLLVVPHTMHIFIQVFQGAFSSLTGFNPFFDDWLITSI